MPCLFSANIPSPSMPRSTLLPDQFYGAPEDGFNIEERSSVLNKKMVNYCDADKSLSLSRKFFDDEVNFSEITKRELNRIKENLKAIEELKNIQKCISSSELSCLCSRNSGHLSVNNGPKPGPAEQEDLEIHRRQELCPSKRSQKTKHFKVSFSPNLRNQRNSNDQLKKLQTVPNHDQEENSKRIHYPTDKKGKLKEF